MSLWDRVKFLLLIGGAWLFLVWADMADDPNLSFSDGVRLKAKSARWLLILLGIEAVRQVHNFIGEKSAGYHGFWTRFFGAIEKRTGKMNDWTRYRMARAFKYLLVVAMISVVLGRVYDVSPIQGLFRFPSALWSAMPFLAQVIVTLFIVVMQFVALFWFLSKGGMETYFPDDIKTRFSDVWGQDHVVERVKENMLFLENPESVEEKGGYVPGGILLWGPPGTGKTLMAEAVAGETGKPYVFIEPGAFSNMFIGVGILKVKSLFRKLRKLALRYGGVIAFFDEADALGNRGALAQGGWNGRVVPPLFTGEPGCHGMSYMSQDTVSALFRDSLSSGGEPVAGQPRKFVMGGMGAAGMGTLEALLAEMSGLKKPRGFFNRRVRRALGMQPKPPPKYRMLVIMATNMPQSLDEALLRPGRIDRIYRVGYPSKEGRKMTYRGYLNKVQNEVTDEQLEKLAIMTPYATGASMKDLVNEALVVAIRDGRDKITWEDIVKAKLLKRLGPPEGVEYPDRERHATAVHEACHAIAFYRLQKNMVIDIATIEKGQNYLGMVSPIPIEEQFTSWKSLNEADIITSIASLVGERMFFDGDSSSGVSQDLQMATQMAMYMEGFWGMGSTIGSHAVVKATGNSYSMVDGTSRNLLETELGRRIETRLRELEIRTEQLLRDNRREVLAIAHALETYKTVTGDDIAAIVEGHAGPLVDGRPYHDPEFMRVAEEYHETVVAAHKRHGPVGLPLPKWSTNGTNGSAPHRHPLSFEPPRQLDTVDAESTELPAYVPADGDGAAAAENGGGHDHDGHEAHDGPAADANGSDAEDEHTEAPPPEEGRRRTRRPRE